MQLRQLAFGLCLFTAACSPFSGRFIHDAPLDAARLPATPDYRTAEQWAALPSTADEADNAPASTAFPEAQAGSVADVFWIYPTIYTDDPNGRYPWNASTTDADLNARIDESTIRMQASVFNAAGRVYAPRYRQAHISAYYTDDDAKAEAAFDTAYADVQRAFELYLSTYNHQRPIIIAGHSQGTTHAKRLVREYFDPAGPLRAGPALAERFVAAYLIGMPVLPEEFGALMPCANPNQTGCYVSWRTWQRPATPWQAKDGDAGGSGSDRPVVVNPLTWTLDTLYASAKLNPGGTLRKLKLVEGLADAQVHQGILWINRPNFFGKRIIRMDNWHAADINLFYESIRRNAVQRVIAWQASN